MNFAGNVRGILKVDESNRAVEKAARIRPREAAL